MKTLPVLLALLLVGCRSSQQPTPNAERPTPNAVGASLQVKPGHPRIWLDATRRQWLRDNPNRLEWKRLLTNCEDGLHRDQVGLPPTYDSALNYALVYQVTGSQRHAAFAVKLVERTIAQGIDALTHTGAVSPHGFGARIVLPEVGVSYDWLYDYLTPAQRTRWANALMAWSDWLWLESNPTRTTWSQRNPGDNFYIGYLQTLLAALAVSGEHPRAQYHLDLGLTKLDALNDYLERYGAGGVSLEGTNYGTWIRHAYLLAALSTATVGGPTVGSASFLSDIAVSRWHLTAPDKKHMAPLGSQAVEASAPVTEDHTAAPLVALSYGDPTTRALAKAWLDSVTYTRKRQNSWMPALWYDNRVRAADWRQLPTTYHATGSGTVSSRSSWEPDATWLVYQCGPVLESHQDYAAGEWMLWRNGEWLTGPARLWGLGGGLLQSEFNNVLLVGGKGQVGQVASGALPKTTMKITSLQMRPSETVIVSEAGRAYDYYKSSKVWPVLERWERTLTFRMPDRLTVRDQITKVNAADNVVWQLHCKKEPTGSGNGYTVQGASGRLVGRVLEPSGAIIDAVAVNKGKSGAMSSWDLQVTVAGGQKDLTMTNELEVTP